MIPTMLTIPSSSTTANILFGPTQHGKSTFLDFILSKKVSNRPAVGKGNGESVTRSCSLFRDTSIGMTIDLPGINDTGLLVDPEMIEKEVALLLAEENIDGARFLVFDSLADSLTQILPSLEKLIEAFGDPVKSSIIVIASKLDRADKDEVASRLEVMAKLTRLYSGKARK